VGFAVLTWLSLTGLAPARKLDFPLLGMELKVPDAYTIEQATSGRVTLMRKNSPIRVALYRVEFGNLEKLTADHEEQMLYLIRKRLGQGGRVSLYPLALAGRPGRQVVASGQRAGASWGMNAGWSLRGGQARVIEVLYPLKQQTEAQSLFQALCRDLVWSAPERG
jgi:hypothetical protein